MDNKKIRRSFLTGAVRRSLTPSLDPRKAIAVDAVRGDEEFTKVYPITRSADADALADEYERQGFVVTVYDGRTLW